MKNTPILRASVLIRFVILPWVASCTAAGPMDKDLWNTATTSAFWACSAARIMPCMYWWNIRN